jgi:diguanylate cyclase (GGDEF)-like protein
MPIEALVDDEGILAIRIDGEQFECDPETGITHVPKARLAGQRLSDIPEGVIVKPVEPIENGNIFHITFDYGLTRFAEGSAAAEVERMERRKFWDEEVGLSKHIAAFRQAIQEAGVEETDFDDDGDYIFVRYQIDIDKDLPIQRAVEAVESTIERLYQRTERILSRRCDPLTGLFDRGSFALDLPDALTREPERTALLMVDVDHFKTVNDRYGHQIGDAVLKAVAECLSTHAAQHRGTVYRYGGEEIALVLSAEGSENARSVADGLRAAVEALRAPDRPNVTVSVGVARSNEHETPASLIKRADEALYLAKSGGRNRVVVAD